MFEKERRQAYEAANELCGIAGLGAGQIFVVGCSSSEIVGERIGTGSNIEAAGAVFDGIYDALRERGIYLAAQCCEHLNRAIVIESAAAGDAERVCVVPQPKAGGSFATTAYRRFSDPVMLEEIRADAGLDIGGVMIGMHLKRVAVPVRLEHHIIGAARVMAARTRPKFIGGARAVYDEAGK
ncbi:MAG: TIGR01440 family protein [Clostridia bacterium]|nr:TIGR01440 family protein [Clostridia bacterium]